MVSGSYLALIARAWRATPEWELRSSMGPWDCAKAIQSALAGPQARWGPEDHEVSVGGEVRALEVDLVASGGSAAAQWGPTRFSGTIREQGTGAVLAGRFSVHWLLATWYVQWTMVAVCGLAVGLGYILALLVRGRPISIDLLAIWTGSAAVVAGGLGLIRVAAAVRGSGRAAIEEFIAAALRAGRGP